MQERALPKAIEKTLGELGISGYKAALRTGWDPSFLSKVLKGNYPMGLKRLTRFADAMRLSAEQRARLSAAYTADTYGRTVAASKQCKCPTCQTLREYTPGLV